MPEPRKPTRPNPGRLENEHRIRKVASGEAWLTARGGVPTLQADTTATAHSVAGCLVASWPKGCGVPDRYGDDPAPRPTVAEWFEALRVKLGHGKPPQPKPKEPEK